MGGLANSADLLDKESAPSRIPGYCGYIPGVKAENVFGESYGKTSTQSGKGEIVRGFDQDPQEKFRSVAQQSYTDQRELLARIREGQSPRRQLSNSGSRKGNSLPLSYEEARLLAMRQAAE